MDHAPNDPDNWRRKYLEAIRQQEGEQRQWATVESLQRRLISRLCIAARGLDARLDQTLIELNTAVRATCTSEVLDPLFERLTRAITQLPERDPAAAAGCHRTLAKLLADIEFLPALQPRADLLCQQAAGTGDAQTPAIAAALALLLAEQHGQLRREKAQAEQVLQQVRMRLDEIATHLLSESRDREAATQSGSDLNDRLLGEIQALDDNVRSARELGSLQEQVRTRLELIGGHLREYRERESTRLNEYRERAERMRNRIDELERTTQSLRRTAERGQHLAMTDALTGIANRLAYEEHIGRCMAARVAGALPLVIGICDIDLFKRINDGFGHPAGDRVLRVVARVLGRSVRDGDFVGRYGGEEFVLVFQGLAPDIALRRVDSLRRMVEQIEFHVQEQRVLVTISAGVTAVAETDTAESAFERADRALYQAKREGRNRCVVL